MRLLLTHGFFLDEDPKEQQILRPYPPLGILYLSSYLRSRGYDVEVYDSTFGSRAELYDILDQGPGPSRGAGSRPAAGPPGPALLGIYTNLLTRQSVLAIIQRAKANNWQVVLGGPEPANYAQEYLAAGVDYIIQGEGELPLEQLLQGNPNPPGTISALATGHWPPATASPQIPNLDLLPWPDRQQIDIPKYLQTWRQKHGQGSVSLITARGCPYHCRWCSHSTFGKTHRRRSVTNVADEAEWILKQYNPEMFWYADDVFTIHPGWTLNYAAELKRRGIRVPFECITRADRLNDATADALAEMGCFRIWIGSESGSQKILDAMQRGVRVEQVESAIHLAQSRGIQTGMFLMWGYEGEQLEDIEQTVALVERSRPDVYLTTMAYPIKGTPYYAEVENKLVRPDWQTSTDRDLQIQARPPREYYQHADALLKATMDSDPARITSARSALHSFTEAKA